MTFRNVAGMLVVGAACAGGAANTKRRSVHMPIFEAWPRICTRGRISMVMLTRMLMADMSTFMTTICMRPKPTPPS